MNLQSPNKRTARAVNRAAAGFFGQTRGGGLFSPALVMPLSIRIIFFAVCAGFTLGAAVASAQTNYYTTNGAEYALVGSLPGDQVFPSAAIATNGGFMVWQDNVTDGDSWGVSAERLDATLSGTLSPFRVNVTGAGSQENPQVALLKNGGAVFVWQGGQLGSQHVYARFLTPTNTFLTTNDVLVNTFTNNFQINPAVAVLNNSNVVFVWASYDQAGSNSMQDVYGQIFSPAGQKVGGEFLVNQFTNFNQRTPSVAALAGGGFVVAWVSEQERQTVVTNSGYISSAIALLPSVDIYARLYQGSGTPSGNEFLVNTDSNPCSSPAVAAAADGSFLVAWTAQDLLNPNNSMDIHARTFTSAGSGGAAFYVNSHLYGDQYVPRISVLGLDYLVTWTSLGQDGSREGVYGQFVHNDGTLVGGEFRVNTTTLGQQLQPAVTSDGVDKFLVVWTSFTGYPNTFDLFAQRYINVNLATSLPALGPPFVWVPFVVSSGAYQPQLVVSWAPVQGFSVSHYEVYVDGAVTNVAAVATNQWTMTATNGLAASSTHSFQVDYVLTSGQHSPLSPAASGTTWQGYNWGGIPFEWMMEYYGSDFSTWPSASSRPDGTGLTLSQIFLSGGNPTNSATWLQQTLMKTSEGMFLGWNTEPGATYQVQQTTNLTTWSNLGSPRFAAGTTDSIYVGGSAVGYYRVVLLR
jgi:hypothetical protein